MDLSWRTADDKSNSGNCVSVDWRRDEAHDLLWVFVWTGPLSLCLPPRAAGWGAAGRGAVGTGGATSGQEEESHLHLS